MASEHTVSEITRVSRGRIIAVVLVYALFAAVWILLSDRLLALLFSHPDQVIQISMFKGWFFILITSLLLYGLLIRWFAIKKVEQSPVPAVSRKLVLGVLLLAVTIIIFVLIGVGMSFKQYQTEESQRLQTTAEQHARQIADWLAERQRDAEFLQTALLLDEYPKQAQLTGDQTGDNRLIVRLQQLCNCQGTDNASLLGGNNTQIWRSENAPTHLVPAVLDAAGKARQTGNIVRLEPYRDENDRVLLDYLIPLQGPDSSRFAPVVVMHIDLANWLFPVLESWPVFSRSGETLLVRRDGDQALYLNDLRHQPDAAAKLRVPLGRTEVLATQLLRGDAKPGISLAGSDYRGIPALGAASTVNGTDWYLVAKIDRAEVDAKAMGDVVWVGLVGVLALFALAAGYYLFRQMQQLDAARLAQHIQAERLRALNLLAEIADSSNDAIFAKDVQGRYILFNRAACAYVGKSMDEVLGCEDSVLFPQQQAEKLKAFGQRVMKENRTITEEEILDTLDGQRVFLSTKGPLHDGQGQVMGIFGISRDITTQVSVAQALKQQSETLQQQNRELERFNRAMVGRELDMIKLKRTINDLSRRLGQPPPFNLSFADEPDAAETARQLTGSAQR